MSRDWSKERWRKQYVREPLQHRLWPVMARGLRELLGALAEDDGMLVRDSDDPAAALVRSLGPHPAEAELVTAAVGLLIREGFLARDARSIRIPELPRAQARPDVPEIELATEDPGQALPRRTSTERVREHRQRARTRNAENVSGAVSPGVSPPVSGGVSSAVSGVSSAVSLGVSPGVSPSRGNDHQGPSQTVNREKDRQKDHPSQRRVRARGSVSGGVSSSVSPASLGATAGVSPGVSPSVSGDEKNEDEEKAKRTSTDAERALALPVGERAALVLASPKVARALKPETWPEVIAIADALAEASGGGKLYLGRYEDDDGVQAVVRLFAAGIPERALEYVARVVPKQPWWSADGKRLGLSSLSLELVRRNLPSHEGRARILSPRVAKVIASVGEKAKASDGAA
jgi:hypothetical protein